MITHLLRRILLTWIANNSKMKGNNDCRKRRDDLVMKQKQQSGAYLRRRGFVVGVGACAATFLDYALYAAYSAGGGGVQFSQRHG